MVLSLMLFACSAVFETLGIYAQFLPDYRLKAEGLDPDDARAMAKALAVFGLFLMICALYIWTHP